MKINCAHDEIVSLNDLKPSPKNRNRHSDDQIERLAKILEYQGWRRPVRVSRLSGFITAGHGAVLAAKKNNWSEAPVNYQDYENEEQEYADIQADNAIASWAELDLAQINLDLPDLGPDFDIDMLGLRDFELEPADKYGDKDADATPEVRKTTIKFGDLFQLGSHRLLCGDSTDKTNVETLMNGEKADMVYTDPPYGLDWSGGTWAAKDHIQKAKEWDKKPEQSTIDFILGISEQVILWGGNYFQVPPSRCWLAWNKSNANKTMSDFELAWTSLDQCCKKFESAHTIDGKRLHATQKPVALAEWALSRCVGHNVLDLFLGSGSTLIACEKTNRKCFGSEIDPSYCDVIIRRWQTFTGQMAYLIEDANGKLPSGPVPFAELSSLRSEIHTGESKNIVQKPVGASEEVIVRKNAKRVAKKA